MKRSDSQRMIFASMFTGARRGWPWPWPVILGTITVAALAWLFH